MIISHNYGILWYMAYYGCDSTGILAKDVGTSETWNATTACRHQGSSTRSGTSMAFSRNGGRKMASPKRDDKGMTNCSPDAPVFRREPVTGQCSPSETQDLLRAAACSAAGARSCSKSVGCGEYDSWSHNRSGKNPQKMWEKKKTVEVTYHPKSGGR